DDGRHLDEELNHVDDEHAPETRVRRKYDVQDPDPEQRLPALEPEQDAADLARGEVDRRHDHAVEEQPQVDGAKAADDAGSFARIPDFVELEIGQHAGAPPQPRIEKDRRDPGEDERPPDPVARHTVSANDVGNEV